MARSQRTTSYADVFMLIGRLPWWSHLLCAVLGWWLLRHYASSPLPAAEAALYRGLPDSLFTQLALRQLAQVAQYLLPLALICSGLLSRHQQLIWRRRQALAQDPAALLQRMAWPEFQQLLEETYRPKGYALLSAHGAAAEGAADLLLYRGDERYLLCCRYWRAGRIGVAPLRECFTQLVAAGAVGAAMVSIGAFSDKARRFAAERNIMLIDGALLQQWLLVSQPPAPQAITPAPPPT